MNMVSKSHSARLCFEPKEHRKLAAAGLEFLRPGLGAMFLRILMPLSLELGERVWLEEVGMRRGGE